MKTWTKILLAVLSLVMVLSMAACKPAEQPAESTPEETPKASEPQATEPPATEPPATEPPATDPPATEPPATEPPVVTPEAKDFTEAVQGLFIGDVLDGKIVITNGALSTTRWTGTTLEGYAIASGNAGVNDSTSAIKFPIAVTADAYVKFNIKVDAGADAADFVYIVVDGARHGLGDLLNGEHAIEIPLAAGEHEITIAYRKDSNDNAGATDAAYMSKVTVEKAEGSIAPVALEMVDEAPAKFDDATKYEVETVSYVLNGANPSTVGDRGIIYIKKSHDYPRASFKFTVEEAGTYEVLIVIGGKNRTSAGACATGLVSVDNGAKYYLNSPCDGIEGDAEYFVGLTVELTAGEHDFHMFLADDFNDGDVKSIYFDYICFAKQ